MKYVKLYKIVKVSILSIKQKMKAEGKFEPKLMDVSDYEFILCSYSLMKRTSN
jgi:hypothetical protein